MPTIVATGMRMPRTHGTPPITVRSIDTRSGSAPTADSSSGQSRNLVPPPAPEPHRPRRAATSRSYFLDLAAEEDWPKDQLRDKINALRAERRVVQRSLSKTEHRLDVGKQVFEHALALLDRPAELYRSGSESVRATLNQALFSRLYVDGQKITDHDRQKPFDTLASAYQVWIDRGQGRRTYQRASFGAGDQDSKEPP